MKKCLIVPYFGNFTNYFQLTLNSCGKNSDFDWLIFTDNKKDYNYPKNVKLYRMEFSQFKELVQNKFDFKISLEKPYKLCDFKPAFGYILSDYLKEYDWWGYCDLDVIFGKLSNFITEEMLEKYKKIFVFGHFTLMKNEKKVNELFKASLNGIELHKEVFQTDKSCFFDETWGGNRTINNIFKSQRLPIFTTNYSADIYPNKVEFISIKSDVSGNKIRREKWIRSFFIYDNGHIMRYFIQGKELVKKEYMYIHLQKRKMKLDSLKNIDRYKIISNLFTNIECDNINRESFKKIAYRNINLDYILLKIKHHYISKRLRVLKKSINKKLNKLIQK